MNGCPALSSTPSGSALCTHLGRAPTVYRGVGGGERGGGSGRLLCHTRSLGFFFPSLRIIITTDDILRNWRCAASILYLHGASFWSHPAAVTCRLQCVFNLIFTDASPPPLMPPRSSLCSPTCFLPFHLSFIWTPPPLFLINIYSRSSPSSSSSIVISGAPGYLKPL